MQHSKVKCVCLSECILITFTYSTAGAFLGLKTQQVSKDICFLFSLYFYSSTLRTKLLTYKYALFNHMH